VFIFISPPLNILCFFVLLRFNKKSSKNLVGNKRRRRRTVNGKGMEEWIRGDRGGENHGATRKEPDFLFYIYFLFQEKNIFFLEEEKAGAL
jgi:hypothetical protein